MVTTCKTTHSTISQPVYCHWCSPQLLLGFPRFTLLFCVLLLSVWKLRIRPALVHTSSNPLSPVHTRSSSPSVENLGDIVHGLHSLGAWLSGSFVFLKPYLTCWQVKGEAKLWWHDRRGTNLSPPYARHWAEECQLAMPMLNHKTVLNSALFLLPSRAFPGEHICGKRKRMAPGKQTSTA